MKRILFLLLAGFSFTVAAQPSSALSDAQKAYLAGDIDLAKALFESVLVSDSKNVTARNYLKRIEADKKKAGPAAAMERKFAALILPQVEFKDATFAAALEALRRHAEKASDGQLVPSFVLQGGVDQTTPVTLRLRNVPFTEALRYACEQANARYLVEQYAIAITPKKAE